MVAISVPFPEARNRKGTESGLPERPKGAKDEVKWLASIADQSILRSAVLPASPMPLLFLDIFRQANLSVRFTDKNGDHAEAGKIWENQIFTVKMGLHRPKCTQMYESICQGFRNIWRN